jgi:hypothetical protein
MKPLIIFLLCELLVLQPLALTVMAQADPSDAGTQISPAPVLQPKPSQSEATKPFAKGYWDGRASANRYHSSGGWYAGGIAGGLFLGLVGTLAMTAAASGKPEPPAWILLRMDSSSVDYQAGFLRGYGEIASNDNMWSAFSGGILGTAILVGVYFLAIKK